MNKQEKLLHKLTSENPDGSTGGVFFTSNRNAILYGVTYDRKSKNINTSNDNLNILIDDDNILVEFDTMVGQNVFSQRSCEILLSDPNIVEKITKIKKEFEEHNDVRWADP